MGQFGNESNSDLTWARDGSDNLKKCRQRCEYQSQEMIVTTTNYPNKLTLPLRKDFCYILKKISNICKKTERKKVMEKMYERHGSNLCELVTSSLVTNKKINVLLM